MRRALALVTALASGCINYAVATGDESPRTIGALAAVEVAVPSVVALFVDMDGFHKKPLPYPLRALILVALTVGYDGGIMMLWRAE